MMKVGFTSISRPNPPMKGVRFGDHTGLTFREQQGLQGLMDLALEALILSKQNGPLLDLFGAENVSPQQLFRLLQAVPLEFPETPSFRAKRQPLLEALQAKGYINMAKTPTPERMLSTVKGEYVYKVTMTDKAARLPSG